MVVRGHRCVLLSGNPPRCVCARIFARQAQRGGWDEKNRQVGGVFFRKNRPVHALMRHRLDPRSRAH